MSKSQANKFNNLIFPSGRTVKDCRNDAKKLKKQALLAGEHLSTSKALDLIAEKNRLPGGWHKAIHSLSQDNTLANITVTHVISPSGAIHSSTIPGVRPSVKDESVKALIDELKPTNIEEGLLRKLDSQRTLRCAVVNEQDEAYRIAVISNVEELHAFHHGMYKLGFYQLTEYFTPEKYRQYQIVFAPDRVIYFQFPEWDSRPFDLTASLRKSSPSISIEDLRKITTLFPTPGYSFPLDPTFEPEMKGRDEGMPNPVEENTRIFSVLQKYNRLNLLVPDGADHMWNAAMESKSCRLTALGEHYRRLVEKNRI